jgi:hypothetical protein
VTYGVLQIAPILLKGHKGKPVGETSTALSSPFLLTDGGQLTSQPQDTH